MSLYALDTHTVSYFLKGKGRVAERLLAKPPADIGLPAAVLYELSWGAGRAKAPRDLIARLEVFLHSLRVLPFGEAEARSAARIRLTLEAKGHPIGPIDLLIAATALEQQAVLVTHNTREFARVPELRLVDWYA